ncbi:tetratricopeptide repeat protein [Roseateles sp. LYH14W]|uniref:Tetratricopeptide repeat protein n=1 Tax=Pelomonas parva TaxID=3299032 RepID=A0ABW7F6S1_9BURK
MPLNEKMALLAGRARLLGALLLGRSAAAEAVCDELLARWPAHLHLLATRAHLRAQRGAGEAALVDLQELVRLAPTRSAGDWFNVAYLLDELGRPEQAEPAFRQALALDAKLDRAWYGLGLTLIRLRRLDDAVAALKRNTELQPMSPYGWYQLARVHWDRQQPDEARRIIAHLKGFEPKVAAQLERETGLLV